jgi:hypothetical protein
MGSRMSRSIILGLRIVYVVLMMLFLILILTDSISGYNTVIMAMLILAVVGVEQIMRRRDRKA